MFPRVTHPSATPYCYGVRLACVRPAASVRSEPGSNSQVEASFEAIMRICIAGWSPALRRPLRRPKTARRIKTPKGSENAPFETTPHGAPLPRKTPRGAPSFDESQAHPRGAEAPRSRKTAHDELKYVTARVSHPRQAIPEGMPRRAQGPRRPRFSFFRFNCQTAVKQRASNSPAARGGPHVDKRRIKKRRIKKRHKNHARPAKASQAGLRTRKTLPDPARLSKASQVRRNPRNPEKRNPRPPQKQRRSQWQPYMAPNPNMSTEDGNFWHKQSNHL